MRGRGELLKNVMCRDRSVRRDREGKADSLRPPLSPEGGTRNRYASAQAAVRLERKAGPQCGPYELISGTRDSTLEITLTPTFSRSPPEATRFGCRALRRVDRPAYIGGMQYRKLGRTGLELSEIGFGAWAIGGGWGTQSDEESLKALHRALDLGVNFIDTAAGYGEGRSERLIAKVLKERGDQDKVIVATKTPPAPGTWPPSPYDAADERFSEKYLRENVEERLRNLGTEAIDVLQLHTWTRAWNAQAEPLRLLEKLRAEGKVRWFGISTPEHDQNCVVELMQRGLIDVVQVIYNLFEQEPAAQLLPVAKENNVGIIVRVAFDEGSLTGKFTTETTFPEGDFRRGYFQGDRLPRTVAKVEKIKPDLAGSGLTMPQAALKFVLAHPAVSTVIPGIRNVSQAEANCGVSDLPTISDALVEKLRAHNWRRAFWYGGK